MRRRRYLRSTVAALGLGGAAATALRTAASEDGTDPPADSAPGRTDDGTVAGTGAEEGTGREAGTKTGTDRGTGTPGESFGPLGHVPIEQAAEAVPSADGSHAFVANLAGVRVVDVSDPTAPEVVATLDPIRPDDGDPMRLVMDCTVAGDRLLVVGPGQPSGVGYHGLALFDVSDPPDPALVGSYETGYSIHNCALAEGFAYLARGTGIEIIDVDRERPRSVGRWKPTDADEAYFDVDRLFKVMHDLYVQDSRAYLANWDLGTFVLDVSDPAEPEHLATVSDRPVAELEDPENPDEYLEPPGNDHYVQPSDDGTLLAVGMETWNVDPPEDDGDDPGGPSGIELWDISDLDAPEQVGLIDPPDPPEGKQAVRDESVGYWTTAHNFDLVGEYLYSSWYQGGVRVHDVSDPANPEEAAAWEDGDVASFWTARLAVAGDFFVASDEGAYDSTEGGLYTFPDPSDLSPGSTPPPTATPTPDPTSTPTPTSDPTTTTTPTPDPTTTPDPTATPASGTPTGTRAPGSEETGSPAATPEPEAGGTDTTTTTASGSGSGFGALGGLSAVLGTWWLLGGDSGDNDDNSDSDSDDI